LLLLLASWTFLGTPPAVARPRATGKVFADLVGVLDDGRFRRLLRGLRGQWHRRRVAGDAGSFSLSPMCCTPKPGAALFSPSTSSAALLSCRCGSRSPGASVAFRPGSRRCSSRSLSFAWAWGLGAGDVWPFAVVCLLSGAALGADLTLPAALLADISESPAAGGQESARPAQAGAYFGWWNLVAKLNLALAAGLSLPLLDLVGYRPGDETATQGLAAVYGLLPLLFKTLAAALAWRWRKTLEVC
jgi:GPH family glycoside/pentoside/hexuronide:cation symporter